MLRIPFSPLYTLPSPPFSFATASLHPNFIVPLPVPLHPNYTVTHRQLSSLHQKKFLTTGSFANSKEPLSVLVFFCESFFLPASFSAFRAFHVSCPSLVHRQNCLPVSRDISVVAILAFIITGRLFNPHSDQGDRKDNHECEPGE